MNDICAEMQNEIIKGYKNGSEQLIQALDIYRSSFGEDGFFRMMVNITENLLPKITVFALEDYNAACVEFISNQLYSAIDYVTITKDTTFAEILDYLALVDTQYIFFYEDYYIYDDFALYMLQESISRSGNISACISFRNILDADRKIVSNGDIFARQFAGNIYGADDIILKSFTEKFNYYGTLGTSIFKKEVFCRKQFGDYKDNIFELNGIKLYLELLRDENICYAPSAVVSEILLTDGIDDIYGEEFAVLMRNADSFESVCGYLNVKKSITMFYTDKGEYFNLKPIGDEAVRRGFEVEYTEDLLKKAEIGIYCQHVCHPENSRFSVVLLHDMAQGHNRWPNLWEKENWNIFDLGILPGKFWGDMWEKCSMLSYARPRCGCFAMGYPKGDRPRDHYDIDELRARFELSYEKTILYAPSWENDEKEDDFIRALVSLPVNLLIKHANWPDEYQRITDNINEMRRLHDGIYANVHYMEPEENIMDAIALCDVIVSDESSVMTEGILMNKPSIAVFDWLIPDTVPSRFASVPFDYVIKCKKVELREYIERFISGEPIFDKTLEKGRNFFSNIGSCSRDIVDAIEYYTGMAENTGFMKWKLEPKLVNYLMYH